MSDMSSPALPRWFWIIVIVAVIWNLIGVYAYISDVTMSPETLAKFPPAEQELINARPTWLIGAYAIAVFAGVIGAVLLALRKKAATPAFGVSLAAVVVQMGYVLFGMGAIAKLGATAAIFPGVIFVIAAGLLWFSMRSTNKGWLK